MNFTQKADRLSNSLIFVIIVLSTLVLLFFCSLRHFLFQSGALDLGFFDQGIYLISQGIYPRSSIIDIHMMGDHVAFILYFLGIFYQIYPDIHWLFLVQAIAISVGIIPILKLSQQKGLSNRNSYLLVLIYIFSPIIFNANSTYDFHPDIFIVPCLLWSFLWAEENKLLPFCLTIFILLICKSVFSLTAIFLGLWLILFKQRKLIGLVSILMGVFWFIFATQIVMPMVGAGTARFLFRYDSLGNSYSEIILNIFAKPNLLFGKLFSTDSLSYLILLFAPFVWCFTGKNHNLSCLIVTLPTVAMNILSSDPQQRYLANHYPLPILPSLILIAIYSIDDFTTDKKWGDKFIIFWIVLTFITMSRLNLFMGEYLQSLDTWQANNEAIALVKNTQGNILTTHEIAPHVTHRQQIKMAFSNLNPSLEEFDYILLNTRHPGYQSDRNYALSLVEQAKKISSFKLEYQRDDVYLFSKNNL